MGGGGGFFTFLYTVIIQNCFNQISKADAMFTICFLYMYYLHSIRNDKVCVKGHQNNTQTPKILSRRSRAPGSEIPVSATEYWECRYNLLQHISSVELHRIWLCISKNCSSVIFIIGEKMVSITYLTWTFSFFPENNICCFDYIGYSTYMQ